MKDGRRFACAAFPREVRGACGATGRDGSRSRRIAHELHERADHSSTSRGSSTHAHASPPISGSAATRDATAGAPQASASSRGRPKPSSSDGIATAAAPRYSAASASSPAASATIAVAGSPPDARVNTSATSPPGNASSHAAMSVPTFLRSSCAPTCKTYGRPSGSTRVAPAAVKGNETPSGTVTIRSRGNRT